MLITFKILLIIFQQKRITLLDFFISILDLEKKKYKRQKLLIFYPKLLTIDVKLILVDYQ